MSKMAITRLFVAAMVAFILGVVLEFAAVIATFAGGVITIGGPTFVQVNGGSAAWLVLILITLGWLAMTAGTITALVSWIAALLNTSRLEDKTWFVILLVLGLVSFGFVAMVAYVIAGPDGRTQAGNRSEVVSAASG